MCGITGLIRASGVELTEVMKMNNRAAHRGPDGEGYWLWNGKDGTGHFFRDPAASNNLETGIIGMGHRRLAILDLSDAGLQPMSSPDEMLWMTFNGEIYNYLELRSELKQHGHNFYTRTDTEVILAAYDQWGTDCFSRFNGMWGLAVVDLRKGVLVLSRDRLGVKPLYVWMRNGTMAFASEIKQFLALPEFVPIANMDALVEYVDTGYENPPATLFKNVHAFPPGCWAAVSIHKPAPLIPQAYWHPEKLSLSAVIRDDEVQERTRELFEDAVRLRLRSDVPVGVCLSGGLDSSAIFGQAQLLTSASGTTTYAFSATFADQRFDESKYIDIVLDKFHGRGYQTRPTPEGFLDDFDDFIYHHDEPPGSLGQYAAWTVMRLAQKQGVPVLLNGQGGDELFSGYWPAYYLFLRQVSRRAPLKIPMELVRSILPGGNPLLVSQLVPHLRQYIHRKNRSSRNILLDQWQSNGYTLEKNWATVSQSLEPEQYRLREIRQVHLPRLLKWDDRNSMAFSIEGRYPFLDYRMVEWALTLPPAVNLNRGWNKLLLRRALGAVLPAAVQWRKSKIGFETPQSEWIRGVLHPVLTRWAAGFSDRLREIVNPSRLKILVEGLLASEKLHRMDERHFLLLRIFFLDRWLKLFEVQF